MRDDDIVLVVILAVMVVVVVVSAISHMRFMRKIRADAANEAARVKIAVREAEAMGYREGYGQGRDDEANNLDNPR
jgi:Tfp pilus assembly protein PilX